MLEAVAALPDAQVGLYLLNLKYSCNAWRMHRAAAVWDCALQPPSPMQHILGLGLPLLPAALHCGRLVLAMATLTAGFIARCNQRLHDPSYTMTCGRGR